jgi:hypothetical protein
MESESFFLGPVMEVFCFCSNFGVFSFVHSAEKGERKKETNLTLCAVEMGKVLLFRMARNRFHSFFFLLNAKNILMQRAADGC